MTFFPYFSTLYKWMDNVICHHIKHSVSGGQFNVFRHLKMHRSVQKQYEFNLISHHI